MSTRPWHILENKNRVLFFHCFFLLSWVHIWEDENLKHKKLNFENRNYKNLNYYYLDYNNLNNKNLDLENLD